MQKFIKVLIIVISFSFVCIIAVGTILPPYKEFSEIENRNYYRLSIQDLTFAKLKNGELFKNIDRMFNDQVYRRDKFVELYSWVQYKLGAKKINDKVLGKDGYEFIVHYPQLSDKYINNLNKLGNFDKSKGIKTFYALIPTSDLVNIDKVPDYFRNDYSSIFGQINTKLNNNITYINLYNTIKNANKFSPQYYKTDHHWNTNGVFTGYTEIISAMNKTMPEIGMPYTKNDFDFKVYKNVFLGSSGRVLTTSVSKNLEDISLYYPKFKSNIKVTTKVNNNFPTYVMDNISQAPYNNDYSVYLGGASLDLTLRNPYAKSNKTAIVVGVSFAPPLTILLAEHFKEINYIDLRYTTYKDLYGLIDEKKPDCVIFLYYSGEFNDTLYTFKK